MDNLTTSIMYYLVLPRNICQEGQIMGDRHKGTLGLAGTTQVGKWGNFEGSMVVVLKYLEEIIWKRD